MSQQQIQQQPDPQKQDNQPNPQSSNDKYIGAFLGWLTTSFLVALPIFVVCNSKVTAGEWLATDAWFGGVMIWILIAFILSMLFYAIVQDAPQQSQNQGKVLPAQPASSDATSANINQNQLKVEVVNPPAQPQLPQQTNAQEGVTFNFELKGNIPLRPEEAKELMSNLNQPNLPPTAPKDALMALLPNATVDEGKVPCLECHVLNPCTARFCNGCGKPIEANSYQGVQQRQIDE